MGMTKLHGGLGRFSFRHCFDHRGAERRRAVGDQEAGRFHRFDLGFGRAFAAGDDRAGMAHAAARRRRDAGDEADDRVSCFLAFLKNSARFFFGAAADFADHDDALGFVVGQEHFQAIDEVGAVDRIAADADAGRLAEAGRGGLRDRFIGQRAGARDDARSCRACGYGRA